MTPSLDAFLATRPQNTARSYRPAVLAWLDWLGKDPARATATDAAAYAGHLAATSKPGPATPQRRAASWATGTPRAPPSCCGRPRDRRPCRSSAQRWAH